MAKAKGVSPKPRAKSAAQNPVKAPKPPKAKPQHTEAEFSVLKRQLSMALTAHKRLQAKLEHKQVEMEACFAERTLELTDLSASLEAEVLERKAAQGLLARKTALLQSISRAQSLYLRNSRHPRVIFERLLLSLITLTESQFGFIGEVFYDDENKPFFKTHALTNIAWDEGTRALYEKTMGVGMEFHNLKNLLGRVMTERRAIISNDPATDPRRGGLPEGHPPLKSFFGIPFIAEDRLVGMAGVANAAQYGEDTVEYLRPFTAVSANIIMAYRNEVSRMQAEESLRANERFLQSIIDCVADPIMIIDREYNIRLANTAAGLRQTPEGEPRKCYMLTHRSEVPCSGEDHPCPLDMVLGAGGPVRVVHRHMDEAGRWRHMEIAASPLMRRDGSIEGVIESMRDITERVEAEEVLRKSVRQKEMLMREVHHRVKNNLMIVQSLFRLQSTRVKDPEMREMFMEGISRIKSIGMIHELLYKAEDMSRLDLGEYLKSLATGVVRTIIDGQTQPHVSLLVSVEHAPMDVDTIVPCGLIVNELVTNALKHAFPEGKRGILRLGLKALGEGAYCLSVADDGIGMPDGININQTETLGMQIVTSLVTQIGGKLRMKQEEGTLFEIEFKERKHPERA